MKTENVINKLLVIPLLATLTTPIEGRGRFISTSDLYLHEKCSVVRALRATRRGPVYIVPCIRPSKNIVNLLLLRLHRARIHSIHIVEVWASGAAKAHATGAVFQKK